jgi:hypothetical protein
MAKQKEKRKKEILDRHVNDVKAATPHVRHERPTVDQLAS